jgi:uncharacterized cupredoxin-like copper-binding protein
MTRPRNSIIGTALIGAALLSGGAANAAPHKASPTKISVTATEFHYKLSKLSVRHGVMAVFTVKNRGSIRHDFKIAGKKTKLLGPGKTAALKVTFKKAGKYPYLCTVPGHAAAGMKGSFRVR